MQLPRASGLLLHPTSLPGPFGIGDLGPEAWRFVDRLAAAGQHWWQVLPLGPAGAGNSPYQSFSAFAGNPLLVSPEALTRDGLLAEADLADYPVLHHGRVDFGRVIAAKTALLERAFARHRPENLPGYDAFVNQHTPDLQDFALFMALKDANGQRAWPTWEPGLVRRDPKALEDARHRHAERIAFHCFVQYQFHRQWHALREHARSRGVRFVGDVPIFVALDSVDAWLRPELFQVDAAGLPTAVAGVPPDFFSATGQLWGNPLYAWEAHAAEGYRWWARRLHAILELVDLVRVDHFRGFSAYWSVPAGATTAIDGRWLPGPRDGFFDAMRSALGGLPVIAEDLGVIDEDVLRLREAFGLPGMCILQMAFTGHPDDARFLPHNHHRNTVVYTGTHDNDTTVGWLHGSPGATTQSEQAKQAERHLALRYLGSRGDEFHWDLIRCALTSVAQTAILPLQDILGLDTSARMNIPGTAEGNWEWRVTYEQLRPEAFDRLHEMTIMTERTSKR